MAAEKPTPPFDTFVFDVDGTLLDTLDDLVVLTNDALAEFNLPPRTREEINSYVGNGVKALMYQAVPEGTPQDVADACRRGCKLGVLSNKFDGGVQFIMNKCLPDAVDVQHGEGGPQNFPRKPDPTGLLATIEELGSTPARTVYIGDSPGDIHVARNAGCYAVGVDWGYHDPADFAAEGWEPDLLVSVPKQILVLAPEV